MTHGHAHRCSGRALAATVEGGSMPISPKLLGEGEHVVIETRTHWKALGLPVIPLVVTGVATGFVLASLRCGGGPNPIVWLVLILAVDSIIWFTVNPFTLWLSAEYTITNRRIINRSGILTRVGRDIPLYRI